MWTHDPDCLDWTARRAAAWIGRRDHAVGRLADWSVRRPAGIDESSNLVSAMRSVTETVECLGQIYSDAVTLTADFDAIVRRRRRHACLPDSVRLASGCVVRRTDSDDRCSSPRRRIVSRHDVTT